MAGDRANPTDDTAPLEGYRPCVGILMFNPSGLAFVAQRIDSAAEAWQMPQGGIDKGEAPRAAALRELKEETGTRSVEIIAETEKWISYDLPPDVRASRWKGRFAGQTQKWFAARFLGSDSDISLNAEHAEFSAWRWVEIDALPGLIVPFKRAAYEAVVAELGPIVRRACE